MFYSPSLYNYGYQQPQRVVPQQYQQQYQQPQMSPPTVHADIIQVDSPEAVKGFQIAPGTSQMFITRDETMILVKSDTGIDTFVKRPPEPEKPPFDTSSFVTKEELEQRLSSLFPKKEVNE